MRTGVCPLRAIPVVLLALCLVMGSPGATVARGLVRSVTVQGVGHASARPDTAQIELGVVKQAGTASEALRANSDAMDKLFRAVTGAGVADRDMQTGSLSVVPQYARSEGNVPPSIVGYQVTHELRLTIRDLKAVGTLLDTLVGEGANRVDGIRFMVSDPSGVLDEARKRALVDARRRAELYAAGAGVKLGRVLLIQEGPRRVGPPEVFRGAMAAASVPVAPGQEEFEVHLTVTYAIE